MSRPTWVGSLSFGLIHVPVRLYSAVEPKKVKFHLLHDADGARVQQKRVCSADGAEVPYEHVVKGYELRHGQYVEVTQGELEAFEPQASRVIELEDFVELGQIDPIFFEATYHLVPEAAAERPYALLAAALKQSGRVGLGRLVMRHRGYLCLVRAFGRGLALSTLYYADEVVSQDSLPELSVAGPQPDPHELQMAVSLIESHAASFEPRRYHDTHRERLLAFLDRRARAQARAPEARVEAGVGRSVPAEPVQEDMFRTIEEGIAALRRDERGTVHQVGAAPTQGRLQLRQQAAREVRQRQGHRATPPPSQDREEPEPS